ncbi:MAG: putative peptidoglycan-binding domain-containing protein [Cyclobacteriaceae bacterium]
MKKKKLMEQNQIPSEASSDTIIINNTLPTSYASFTSRAVSSGSDSFPLKRGSKGFAGFPLLQQALAKTSPGISVDGQFGPQTASALKSAGYPETVNEATFNKITGRLRIIDSGVQSICIGRKPL